MIELTKSQKKTARKLINLGLQRECAKFMQSTKDFMNKNASAEDAHDAYLKLYDKVYQFDKHIARRYDGMSGGRYYITVCYLYYDGVLTDEDIREFDDELYNSSKSINEIDIHSIEEHFRKYANPYNMFVLPKEIGDLGEIQVFIDEQRRK